ncbi:MAG: Calx-beta domain-containing protein [Vicinamibacterales bacterium]
MPTARQRLLRQFRRRLAWVCSLCLVLGSQALEARSQYLYIVQYSLVSETATADGVEYVFRGRLFNLGPAIPGAVATLTGSSPAATVLDGALSFGPVGKWGLAWSTDTASIRRHGRWRDIVHDLRWVIGIASVNRPPTASAGPDQAAGVLDHVVLDGSASTDPDGDPLTYQWSFVSRPAASSAVLSDASALRPTFVVDAPGRYVIALVVHDGSVASDPDLVEVTTANGPPVADAGPDQRLVLGEVARLDGSASTDPDGDRLAYQWQIIARPPGSQAALDDPAAVRPTFVADAVGTYVVRLVVSDGQATSAPDTVELTTENTRPVADAGLDQRVAVGQVVTLDGSGSTDVDGDALTYAWSLVSAPAGSAATLLAPTSVMPRFTADLPGEYVVQLVVHDGQAESDADTVLVSTVNTRPVADAGPDRTVTIGEVVVVDGSASSDADGDPLSFQWTIASAPAGSSAVVQDPTAPATSFVADRPGDYVVQLVVHDGALDSDPDTLVVSTVNSAPIADAGPDEADVPLGAPVALDGSASSDPDGQPLRFAWSLLSRPAGSAAVLTGADTAGPSFVPDAPGTYVAQLVVNDGFVDSAPDTVSVFTANAVPVADAGPDQTVDVGVTVPLDGSGSRDPEGAPLTFQWTLVSRPAGSSAVLSDVAAAAPVFVADTAGQYTAQLVVDDGVQASAADLVVVTATAPEVTVEATDPDAAEGGADPGVFTLSRTGAAASPLTVEIALDGTAVNGTDYDAIGATVTFAAGEATATVTVTPVADQDAEGDETVTLALVAAPAYTLGTPASATVIIADLPLPVVTVTATDAAATEAGDPGAFTVTRTAPLDDALTVQLETSGGTATPGVDVEVLPAVATIPAGVASVVVQVVPIDDTDFEAPESVILRVRPDPAYIVGTPPAGIVTIADDDTLVSVLATDPTATENSADTASVTFSRLGDTTGPLTVGYTVSGTATAGADYVALAGAVTFAPGAADVTVTLTTLDDDLFEAPETVTIAVAPGPGYHEGPPDRATMTILDDERPVVTISLSDGTASEAGPEAGAFEIARTGPTSLPLVVQLSTLGDAVDGVDYQALGGAVTIPAGAVSVLLPIVPIDDDLVEGAESVVVRITPAPDYLVGVPGAAGFAIADDDIGAVTIEATDASASEVGLDPGLFTLRRSGSTAAPLTVFLGREGTAENADHEPFPGFVVFAAGETVLTVPLTPRRDNLVEGTEALTITILPRLDYVVGSPSAATVTIADDPAVISLTASQPSAAEAGRVPGAFLLTRAGGNLAAALSVQVTIGGTAIANGDYVVLSGVVSFPAGETGVSIPVLPLVDNLVEPDETVVMTLVPSVGGTYAIGTPSPATVTIADDPPIVEMVTLDADAAEAGLDPGAAQVRRSGGNVAAALNVLFVKSGTATNGFDYQSLGGGVSLVTIPAGQATATVTVTPVADNVVEPAETVILTLTANAAYAIGAADSVTVTITDDPPVVEVVATDPTASEAGADPGVFTFTRSGGDFARALTVGFTRSGTASLGSDFATILSSVTIPAGQSSVTLTITPVDDGLVEGPETVVVTVNPSVAIVPGASATAAVTILDND